MRIDPLERLMAIRFALAGLVTLFRTQANAWIYSVITVGVIIDERACSLKVFIKVLIIPS